MAPLFAALIAATITVVSFIVLHAMVKTPWIRNTLIIVATVVGLALGGILAGSPERSELTGQIYFGIIVACYILGKLFGRKGS